MLYVLLFPLFFQVVGVANIWDSIPWFTILDQIDVTPSHKLLEKKSTKSRSATIWHCPTATPGKAILIFLFWIMHPTALLGSLSKREVSIINRNIENENDLLIK